jgi:parallel beta-helix repeat protein
VSFPDGPLTGAPLNIPQSTGGGGPPLSNNPPQEIDDSAASPGTGTAASRDDHVHPHGNRSGGSLHALATDSFAGFMSPADKVKLDTTPPGSSLGVREWDAVVAPSGGDFTSIVAAFTSGAKAVFVRPGVYNETANIVIPPGGCLRGICAGAVTVVLTAGAQIVVDGTGRFTNAGTVSVTSGSTAVTGAGTLFTTLVAADYILLGDSFYKISSITDDTNLVLEDAYRGTAISGQLCQGQSMIVAAGIENVNVAGAGVTAIRVAQAYRCFFRGVAVAQSGAAGSAPAWDVADSGSLVWETCASENNDDIGLSIRGNLGRSYSMFLLACVFKNNNGAGVQINNTSACVLDSCIAYQNAQNGITVVGTSNRIQLLDSFCSYNDQKGVDISSSAVATVMANSTFFANGTDGIDFNGADSQVVEGCLVANNGATGINGGSNGVIDGCQVRNNGGTGIDMQQQANDTAVSSCIVDGNGGVGIAAAGQSLLNSNRVRNNGGRGIECLNAADGGTITGNVVTGNGGDGIYIQGTSNNWVVTGNRATGNGGAGNFTDLSATTTVGANNFT